MSDSDLTVIIATHKKYEFPKEKEFLPLHLGRALTQDLGYQGDDSGDSISAKNPFFCELTGLYWIWKNVSSQSVSMVHYRRYFKSPTGAGVLLKNYNVASPGELKGLLKEYRIVLPRPRYYFVETVASHYKNAHFFEDLVRTRNVVSEIEPTYLTAFDGVLARRYLHLYNMFAMSQKDFKHYCMWLFPILEELEKQIPYQSYGPYQKRVFGFLAERLFNVWVEVNIPASARVFLPVVNIEGESLVKKVLGLLTRKLLKSKIA